MMLIEETMVPDEALPVEDFKAHLRLGTGFGTETIQDTVLAGFLRAAIAAVEARTSKVLIRRTFSWTLNFWRDRDAQVLPVAPISAISRIVTVGRDGSQTDIPAAAYWFEQDSQRPRLRSVGAVLPTIPSSGSAVITFDAGYGADWSDVPADLKQAVLMLAAHYYEYRHDTNLSSGCMPFGVTSLIERHRNLRIGLGSSR